MALVSKNPFDGSTIQSIDPWNSEQISQAISQVERVKHDWASSVVEKRCDLLREAASVLRGRSEEFAVIICKEMGKLLKEAVAEVEKCALVCDYYAIEAKNFLADEVIKSDASRSYVAYQPLGTVFAIMPWNFPFWQVFRFAAPALAGGNTAVLKHAANVTQCAVAIENVFVEAGFPQGVFRSLIISSSQAREVIEHPCINAVTLTGSETAGRKVAELAGANLKKMVLELGGSDAFIILEDADLALTVSNAANSRFMNAGQSCIAAKRFIVLSEIADRFVEEFTLAAESLVMGDPMDPATSLAPMARDDLRDELHKQVQASIEGGAELITGGTIRPGKGAYYPATILDHVSSGTPAFEEELFGPVASIIRVKDETEAIKIANSSRYGLGGSVWTQDISRGENIARQLESGAVFVNGMVKSDPRLPFGGIKASGYGRELSHHGLHEFLNAKTIWIK